jgi:tyrosyl-tRNA synthetase
MKLLSRMTVSQILQREDFARRSAQNQPISLMEVLYPLMQAYDSVHLKSDMEIGGTDQKFNLLLGRELQKEFGQEPQVVMTLPLLVGLDGAQKMSKSLGNHIGVTDAPKDMYGKLMSISDELMYLYYDLLTDTEGKGVRASVASGRIHPMKAKEDLALKISARFWGPKEAENAKSEFTRVIVNKETPSSVSLIKLSSGTRKIYKLLHECGLTASSSEARRLIMQGATVTLDSKPVRDPDLEIEVNETEHLLRVGARRFARFSADS